MSNQVIFHLALRLARSQIARSHRISTVLGIFPVPYGHCYLVLFGLTLCSRMLRPVAVEWYDQ